MILGPYESEDRDQFSYWEGLRRYPFDFCNILARVQFTGKWHKAPFTSVQDPHFNLSNEQACFLCETMYFNIDSFDYKGPKWRHATSDEIKVLYVRLFSGMF